MSKKNTDYSKRKPACHIDHLIDVSGCDCHTQSSGFVNCGAKRLVL